MSHLRSHCGLLVLFTLLLVFPLTGPNSYLYDVAIRIALSAIVVIGLNLLFGYAGQISLGHAAFLGLGAYTSAILTTHFGWSPLAALITGAAITGILAFLIARPILKLRGHHLAMATLALGLIAAIVFTNEIRWTGGSDGMTVPPFSAFGWSIDGEVQWYALTSALLLLTTWAAINLVNSPAGRALQAIRGSETAARIAGIDTRAFKTRVFVLSAVLASIVGSLSGHYMAFITPSVAGLARSIELLMMVVIGGMASVYGSLAGAALITILPQFLHAFEGWETLVFGVILTAAMIFLRDGIVPTLSTRFPVRRAGRQAATGSPGGHPEDSARRSTMEAP